VERARLYFLLAWFHAIVQERLVYAPLGWSKRYEFSESDLRCACDTIDVWIDSVAMVSRLTVMPLICVMSVSVGPCVGMPSPGIIREFGATSGKTKYFLFVSNIFV